MKIAILNTMAPFIYGGAEFMADSLRDKLIEYGHEAQVIRFHYSWFPLDNIVDGILAARLTKIENTDRVIGMKFPAYLVPHPDKKIWLVHQFRQAYDLEHSEYNAFSAEDCDQNVKKVIHRADTEHFRHIATDIYTISPIVSKRLLRYNGVDSKVLYPPLLNDTQFHAGEYGNYIYYPSRVNASKRQSLVVEAMRYTKTPVKLMITGKGDSAQSEKTLFEIIEKYNLSSKVTYLNQFISENKKCKFYAGALAVAFPPLDEDYGYVTIEAFSSRKAVITCTDSGCPAYFVRDGENGFVAEPTPQAMAHCFDELYLHRKRAKDMGVQAFDTLNQLNITWENVIERMTT